MTGCNAPDCGKPGRPYAAGIRCDDHKPRGLLVPPAVPGLVTGEAGKCPRCGTAALTYGRKICQACGLLASLSDEEAAESRRGAA